MNSTKSTASKSMASKSTASSDTVTAAETPSFDTLLNKVDGIFANARIAYVLTLVERAIEHQEWPRAVDSLMGLADKLARRNVPAAAWRELLWAGAWCGIEAPQFSRIPAIEALFERYATRAWPNNFKNSHGEASFLANKRRAMPWDLADLLELADLREKHLNGLMFGQLIMTIFPEFPLGFYAIAHFADRLLHTGHPNLPKACKPPLIAKNFARAEELARLLEMPALAEQARLRGGAILLRSGEAIDEGRELLRDVQAPALSRGDRIWYSVGMAHSSFWLDRVRAADQIIALSAPSRNTASQNTASQKTADTQDADLEAATRHLIDCAPLQLQPLEVDRLEQLIDLLGPVDDTEHLASNLKLRAHLNDLTDLPLTHAGKPAEQIALNTGPAGQAAADFCQLLQNFFAAHKADKTLPAPNPDDLNRIEEYYPLAATTLSTLFAILTADATKLATALGSMEGKLRITQIQPAELKPVGLIWPSLFAYLEAHRDDTPAEDAAMTTKRIGASTREIFGRWIVRAPQPSYGWWTLSARVLRCTELDEPWPVAAAACTQRALRNGVSSSPDLKTRLVTTLIDRAVQHGDDDVLQEWLEVGEAYFSQHSQDTTS